MRVLLMAFPGTTRFQLQQRAYRGPPLCEGGIWFDGHRATMGFCRAWCVEGGRKQGDARQRLAASCGLTCDGIGTACPRRDAATSRRAERLAAEPRWCRRLGPMPKNSSVKIARAAWVCRGASRTRCAAKRVSNSVALR